MLKTLTDVPQRICTVPPCVLLFLSDVSCLFQSQRWSSDETHLRAWQKGMTGYPLVDAAMRELWLTGWMCNYSRHVVASFLVAYLHLHWIHGYRWFQVLVEKL